MSLSPAEITLLRRRLARKTPGDRLPALLFGVLAAIALAPAFVVAAAFLGAGVGYALLASELDEGLARIQDLESRETFETTRIYDRDGVLLREVFGEGKRTYVSLSEMPETLRLATVAVEDGTFYTNAGVDAGGITRAVYGELTGQPDLGGGSTITQQFVRHVAFSYEERVARSYTRKAKEIILALILTQRSGKDQILEWYLNEIYYGNLAYGIEAAAQVVFGKPARELGLAESALLAGLPQLPASFDPLSPDPEVRSRVKARQATVLDLMVDNGFITRAEAAAAKRRELEFEDPDEDLFDAPHFVVHVQDELEAMLGGERLARGGIDVYTTLDLDLQRAAERAVREHVERLREAHNLNNAALVAVEPATGQVLAMVGSADYWDDSIDGRVNVAIRDRQPGSSIKPVTYATAIENGMSPATMLWDVPMELWTPSGLYEPQNYDEEFHGPVRLREALANSYNIPALKLLNSIQPADEADADKHGVELTVEMAHRMGITGLQRDPWDYGLSLTLGGGEVTLLDLTTAYATLANLGERVRPNVISSVRTSGGEVLYELADDEDALGAEAVLDPRTAFIVTDFMADNEARTPAFGPSSALQLGVPAAAKTGTTNDYRDNWTLGFTPYIVAGVWAGNSDNSEMLNSSGLTGAAPIWNAFMRNVVADEDLRAIVRTAREEYDLDFPTSFERPDGLVRGHVCRLQSLRELSTGCRSGRPEWFFEDGLPEGVSESGDAEAGAVSSMSDDFDPVGGDAPAPGGIGPDVWTIAPAVVIPMPPPPEDLVAAKLEEGEELLWAPALLCAPGEGGIGMERAQPVAVLPLPEEEQERDFVIEWASEHGWAALEPSQQCTQAMVDAALEPGSLPGPTMPLDGLAFLDGVTGISGHGLRAQYELALEPGTLLSGPTVITGTAIFDLSQVEYFKIELGRGTQPTEWITLGDIHRQPVASGPLETLDAGSLPPGDYIVRLVLVRTDGNFVTPPHSVPIRIGAQGGDGAGQDR